MSVLGYEDIEDTMKDVRAATTNREKVLATKDYFMIAVMDEYRNFRSVGSSHEGALDEVTDMFREDWS